MRNAIVITVLLFVVSLCITPVECDQGTPVPQGNPGTPVPVQTGDPGEIVGQSNDPTVAPLLEFQPLMAGQKITEPQRRELGGLLANWKTEDKVAKTAEASGNHKVARRHRSRANELAMQICQLRRQIASVDEYHRANPLGGTKESQAKVHGWMADNGYSTHFQVRQIVENEYGLVPVEKTPAVPPAGPAPTPATTDTSSPKATKGAGTMEGVPSWVWTWLVVALVAYVLYRIGDPIWGRINEGIRVARGEGWVTRLEEQARGGRGAGGAGQDQQNVDPAYMGAYRNAIEAPRPPEPIGGSLVSGGRYTNANGQTSSWESWRPDRTPQAPPPPQVPGVINVDLRDLRLDLGGEQPPFGQGRR